MADHQISGAVTPGPPNDQVEQRGFSTLIIGSVGGRHDQSQGHATPIHQHMPLAPQLGPIPRVFACFRTSRRGGNNGTVQDLPVPSDAALMVIGTHLIRPNLFKDSHPLPFLKPAMAGTARTELGGDRLPLTTGAQTIENAPRTFRKATMGRARRSGGGFGGQIFHEHCPQLILHLTKEVNPPLPLLF